MLALMLDPKYKSMCVVITYLGHEIVTTLVINQWTIVSTSIVGGNLQGQMMPINVDILMSLPHLWTFNIYFNRLTQM
jgi:hypothetical protein